MLSETESPKPLSGDEVKIGIAQKVADAVYEGLAGCTLFRSAFPKFKTVEPIKIRLLLDTSFLPGEEFDQYAVVDNHEVSINEGDPVEGVEIEVSVDIPPSPPNAFREETGQPITVNALENGRTVERTVRYAAKRGPGRPKKVQ